MEQLTIEKMQQMQVVLQEKYKHLWGGLSPEKAIEKLLWLHGEVGEVSDIIKKNGVQSITKSGTPRERYIEEMCDVLMYFNDLLICFNISPEEFESAYLSKYQTNLKRW